MARETSKLSGFGPIRRAHRLAGSAEEPHLLLPSTSLRAAIDIFNSSAEDELAVVDSGKDRHIIGYLSEAAALRRYSQELERNRAEEQGESAIFAPEK